MKGSVIARGDSYRIKVPLGKDPVTGKYTAYYETVKGSRPMADKRLRQLLIERDKGTFVKTTKNTVAEYLKSWLSDYCSLNLSPRTCELYSYMCAKHIIPAIGSTKLSELKPQQIQHLYAEKVAAGLSSRTVQIIHVTLHKALKNAVRTGLVVRNIAESVDAPKGVHREVQTMSETDIHLFLDRARDTEYFTLFYLYLFTGCRRSELLALRWKDTNLELHEMSINRSMQYLRRAKERITFKEPKTRNSRRTIALSPSTVEMLDDHYQKQKQRRKSLKLPEITSDDLVFSHYDGSPMLPQSVTQAWERMAKRTGLKGVRLHDARHSHATIMLKQGVHPKIVSERLGHASIAITLDTYSHIVPGLQQAAANKFDEIIFQIAREMTPR
jgi:integrase